MDNKEQSETPQQFNPLTLKLSISKSLNERMGKTIVKLEEDIEHKDKYIKELQDKYLEDIKQKDNSYKELQTKLEEEEDHNKELVELINEMMDMIKDWHTHDMYYAKNSQESRNFQMRRYKRDLENIGVM